LRKKEDDSSSRGADIGSATEAALQVIPRDISAKDLHVSGEPAVPP
jgi:hypothetical protein